MQTEKIVDMVCEEFGISKQELLAKNTARKYSYPRNVAMKLIREYSHKSYPWIGKYFSMDHSTVMRAVKVLNGKIRLKKEIPDDLKFRHDQLEKRITALWRF